MSSCVLYIIDTCILYELFNTKFLINRAGKSRETPTMDASRRDQCYVRLLYNFSALWLK